MLLNQNERYFRKVIGAIGASMLFFLAFFYVFTIGASVFSMVISSFFEDPIIGEVLGSIAASAAYLVSFMLPVAIMKAMIRKAGYPWRPMQTSLRISPWVFLIVPAGLALNFSAAYLNQLMLIPFSYTEFLNDMLLDSSRSYPVYFWVLEFIGTCVVPGFCEEFLFRGAILSNCRPFGRTNAIMISAFLFSMMHQNAGQAFYTFVLGIFLGIVYEKTQSIWIPTVIHIFNNFFSTFESMIFSAFKDSIEAGFWILLLEIGLFVVGFFSLMILIKGFFSQKKTLSDGVFGKTLPASDGYAEAPIPAKRAVRLFLTPTMIVFLSLVLLLVLLLLGESLLVSVYYG